MRQKITNEEKQPGPTSPNMSRTASYETPKEGIDMSDSSELAQASTKPAPRVYSASVDVDWLREKATSYKGQVRLGFEVAAEFQLRVMHISGLGWFHWTGKHWEEDLGNKWATNAALATMHKLQERHPGDKDLSNAIQSCQSSSGIKGILDVLSSLPGIAVKAKQVDADPYLLNCANGTLDLHTLELRPHNPADRLTKITRAAYMPGLRSALWLDFLDQVLPDKPVRDFLQRVVGLALIGKVLEHIFPILTGTGANGKGVWYGGINFALGDYAHIAEPSLFDAVRKNPNSPSPAFADLKAIRVSFLSETEEGAELAPAVLKRLTGGDTLKARKLYQNLIEFEPSHTPLMITNHLPKLPADDPAVWRRVRVVPFDVVVPEDARDPHLPEKLELEADGILTWAIEGLAMYLAHGLGEPTAVHQATSTYAQSQDDVQRFVEDSCTTSPSHDGDTTKVLHTAYLEWAESEGMHKAHQLGQRKFGEALDRLGFVAKRTNRGAVRTGLAVAQDPVVIPPPVLGPQPASEEDQPF